MTDAETLSAPDLRDPDAEPPVVYSGPENLFRLRDITVGDRAASSSMDLGQWASSEGRPIGAGAIGVLIDNATGYALVTARQPGSWTISTEISIDAFPELLTATSLTARSTVDHADTLGGFATARVHDERGRLVAIGTQRCRWVPFARTDMSGSGEPASTGRASGDLPAMLGATLRTDGSDVVLSLTSRHELENPSNIMHGGVSIAAADVVATTALAVEGMPPLATSSLRVGYTRAVMDGDLVEYRAVTRHRGRGLGIVEVTASVGGKTTAIVHIVANPVG